MLKLPEVAQRLGVSEKTARRYIKAGTIPSVFIGNAYRVREEDLEEYVRQAQVGAAGVANPKAEAPLSPEPHSDEGSGQRRRASLPDLKDFLQEKCGSFYLALPHELVKQAWEEADTKETSWQLYEQIRREHAAVVKLADEIRDQLRPFQRDNLERRWLRQANTRMVEAIHRVREKTDA